MTGLMREMTGLEKLRELAEEIKQGEDRKAIAWVRDHGGLDSVKKLLDWVVGHCSTRQQLDFDFWLSGRVMYELGFEEDMADRDEVERRLLARLMPEGMEWPTVDGKPVDFVTGYEPSLGVLEAVSIYNNGACEVMGHDGIIKDVKEIHVATPKVLDADGAEIRVGDTVCGTRDMEPMRVVDTDSRECGFKHIKCEKEGDGFWFYCPDELTHKLPVLAADGKPLREGETVWGTNGGSYHITSVHDGEVFARHVGGSFGAEVESAGGEGLYRLRAEQLTHERPVADTWERLEDDATMPAATYCERMGVVDDGGYSPEELMSRDLVRRCRALAERGQ